MTRISTEVSAEPDIRDLPDFQSRPSTFRIPRKAAWLSLAIASASVAYALQVFTPLRLNTDAIYYLSFADAAARANGLVTIYRQHFLLPKGYSLFLFCLMKAGFFSAFALVLSNLAFFSSGLLLNFETLLRLGFDRKYSTLLCAMTFLSFVSVKNITLPISDFLFFALSAAAWWLMNARGPTRWMALLPALCAVEVRLAGLALFVPLAFLAWSALFKRPKILVPFFVSLVLALTVGIWSGSRYFHDYLRYVGDAGILHLAREAILFHCRDFSELVFNLPLAKLPAWAHPVFLSVGSVALFFFILGTFLLARRSRITFFYLLGYSILILPWPFTDPRFWLPAMPFVFLALHQGIRWQRWKALSRLLPAYIVLFIFLGFVALAYSTRLTFSGPQFPYLYGDGHLRATYLTGCSGDTTDVNQDALALLRRYEWHCSAGR